MSCLARMVLPGLPHDVTQRENRREAIFFEDGDQQIYCDMLADEFPGTKSTRRMITRRSRTPFS
jgi:hypothetical protein